VHSNWGKLAGLCARRNTPVYTTLIVIYYISALVGLFFSVMRSLTVYYRLHFTVTVVTFIRVFKTMRAIIFHMFLHDHFLLPRYFLKLPLILFVIFARMGVLQKQPVIHNPYPGFDLLKFFVLELSIFICLRFGNICTLHNNNQLKCVSVVLVVPYKYHNLCL